jgi:predicted NAD/FAD-dependent oxidoreductase
VDASVPVVVVGAGIAGLAAAQTLRAAGRQCVVLEKSSAPFGRVATRQLGGYLFNYGVMEFELHAAGFVAELGLLGVDVAALALTMQVGGSGLRSALAPLLAGLDLRVNHHVVSIGRTADVVVGFDVTTASRDCLHAAHVILALPAPQVDTLLAYCTDLADLRAQCAQLDYAPSCVVTVLARCDLAMQPSPGWRERHNAAFTVTTGEVAGLVLRQWECVGDHALRLRAASELAVLDDLGCAMADIDALREFHVKHWRYARLLGKTPGKAAYFEQNGIYVVGDFERGTVGSAYQSGQQAARNLLGA